MKINLLYQPSIGWISHVKMQAVQLLAYLSGQIACWKNACTERRLLFLSRWYQQDLRIQSVWPGARPSNGVSKPMSWDCSTWCGFLLCKYTIWQGWAAGWCCEALSSSCPMLSPASALPLAPYLFLVFKFLIAVQVSTSKRIFPFPEGDGYVCLPVSFACPAYLHPSLTVSVGSTLHAPISFSLTLCSVISHFLLSSTHSAGSHQVSLFLGPPPVLLLPSLWCISLPLSGQIYTEGAQPGDCRRGDALVSSQGFCSDGDRCAHTAVLKGKKLMLFWNLMKA